MPKQYTLYFATFECFNPEAEKLANKLTELAESHNFKALNPIDSGVDFTQPKKVISQTIFNTNIELMNKADIIVANLESFRGFNADDGVSFEVGYCYASGKPCYGVINSYPKTYVKKLDGLSYKDDEGIYRDYNGYLIENLDQPCNLMLHNACDKIFQNYEQCLAYLKEEYY